MSDADCQFCWRFLFEIGDNMWRTTGERPWTNPLPAVHLWHTQYRSSPRPGAHSYAVDTQLYHRTAADACVANVRNIISCFGKIKRWMTSNRLKLNFDKTDFILLGTWQQLIRSISHPSTLMVSKSHCWTKWNASVSLSMENRLSPPT